MTRADRSAGQPEPPEARSPVRLRLRLDLSGQRRIGPGKIDLLEAIADTGSISAAGRAMGMSYRRAWLLVSAMNAMFAEPVVMTAAGGTAGGGATLTPFGARLAAAFRRLEARTMAAAGEELGAFVPELLAEAE
jgi:molybdate transport system regulatory protein